MELLAELKVQINTKGILVRYKNLHTKTEKRNYFLQDGYIWELIEMIENSTDENQKIKYKHKLIEAISLLIKYDWDRSKNEITSSEVKKANNIIIFLVMLTGFFFIWYLLITNISSKDTFILMALFILFPLFIPFICFIINHFKNSFFKSLIFQLIIFIVSIVLYFSLNTLLLNDTTIPLLFSIGLFSCILLISLYNSLQIYSSTESYTYYEVAEAIIKSLTDSSSEKNIQSIIINIQSPKHE